MRRPAATLIIAALVVTMTGRAYAHALVKSSAPSDGQLLESSPTDVTVTFTEPPDGTLSFLHVLNSSGKQVETAKSERVAGDRFTLRVPVGKLSQGVYTVSWRAVSTADGHVTAGSFTFGVGVAEVAPTGTTTKQPQTAAPSPASVASRWAFLWGLVLLIGAAASTVLVFRREVSGSRPGVAAAWVLAALGLLIFILAEATAIGVGVTKLLGSSRGRVLEGQAALLGVTLLPVALFAFRGGRLPAIFFGVGAAATALAHAIAGHAGGSASGEAFKVGIQWLHIVAVGTWVGGLPWLILGTRGDLGGGRISAVRRFSFIATISITLVAITGTLRAFDEVGTFHKLTTTSFGKTLIVKVVLFGGLALLGAANRFRLVPALSKASQAMSRLRGTVSGEIGFGVVIIAVTALLAGFVPPALIVEAKPQRPKQLVVTGTDFAKSVRARLVIAPGTVGPNKFQLRAVDFDTGKPVEADRIALGFNQPDRPEIRASSIELQRQEEVWTGSGTALAMKGKWRVTVLIQEPATSVQVELNVTPRVPPQKVDVSRVQGQPTLYTVHLTGGSNTLQVYFDPEKPGQSEMHLTFFDGSGGELPADSAGVTAVSPAGARSELPTRRFGPGHFVADVTLVKGKWRFDITAQTASGPAEATVSAGF